MHARATAARSDSPKTVTAAVTTAAERIARESSNEQTWPKGSPLDAQTRSGPNTGPPGSAQAGTRHWCTTPADYLKGMLLLESLSHLFWESLWEVALGQSFVERAPKFRFVISPKKHPNFAKISSKFGRKERKPSENKTRNFRTQNRIFLPQCLMKARRS